MITDEPINTHTTIHLPRHCDFSLKKSDDGHVWYDIMVNGHCVATIHTNRLDAKSIEAALANPVDG